MNICAEFGADAAFGWNWEGNVQAAIARWLVSQGWSITQASNTAIKQQGIDLIAEKDSQRLLIEVKGFPGTTYAHGPKRGQPKPTQPTLQAKHWCAVEGYADA